MSDIETINHLEWRVKRLENFIGKSDKRNINEIINNLNQKLIQYASNNIPANALLKQVDTINRIVNPDFQRNLLRDSSMKLELILADEERIRNVTRILMEIDTLAHVLDGEHFRDIPNLFKTLDKLLTIHNDVKNQHNEFCEELTSFLQDYAAFNLFMDENLQQYKTILRNHQQQTSSAIEHNPIE